MNDFCSEYIDIGDHIVQSCNGLDGKIDNLPFSMTEKISKVLRTLRFAFPNKKIHFFFMYSYIDEKNKKTNEVIVSDKESAYDEFSDLQVLLNKYFDELKCYISYYGDKYKNIILYMNEINQYLDIMSSYMGLIRNGQN